MVAPSAPSRCAHRGSCPTAEQSAAWSSPAPYLAFFWSAFLSLNYGRILHFSDLAPVRRFPSLAVVVACLLAARALLGFSGARAVRRSPSVRPRPRRTPLFGLGLVVVRMRLGWATVVAIVVSIFPADLAVIHGRDLAKCVRRLVLCR
jgi:hypothetical protein